MTPAPATPFARFELGRVVATPGAVALAEREGLDLPGLAAQHAAGDWGEVDAEDRAANEAALEHGTRVLSAYGAPPSRLWIITDGLTDACPACWAGIGVCEPDAGSWQGGMHFRDDLPPRRQTTTILLPEEY